MAVMPRISFILLVALASLTAPLGGTQARANPIRRVITMLQMMMKKSEDQSSMEEELFDKFMCQCKSSDKRLTESIAFCQDKIPQLESAVEESNALITSLEAGLKQAKQDRSEADKSVAEATTMRNGEAKAYAKDSTEAKVNVKSMGRAVKALKSGVEQTVFLQTPAASLIQGLLATGRPGKGYDREALTAFLTEGDQTEGSGEIIGILEQMKEDMEKDLKAMVEGETNAIAQFEALGSAKSKQIAAANSAVEQLSTRLAGKKVEIVQTKADLKDTNERLVSDQETFGKLKLSCQKRDNEYGILKKQFADERVALSDTIKILADDQAAEVFKKTTVISKGAATFLQVGSTSRHRQQQALRMLRETSHNHPDQPALQLLAKRVASAAKQSGHSKKGFEKIMGLIDNMIGLLGKEANDDKIKKDMCVVDLQKNSDKKVQIENGVKTTNADLSNLKDNLGILVKDLAKIGSDMVELDKAVKAATEQRKNENALFTEMLSETNQAVGILEVAKSRMKEFYPSLLQQPVQNSEEALSFLQEEDSEAEDADESTSSSSTAASGEDSMVDAFMDEAQKMGRRKPQNTGGKVILTLISTIQSDLKKEFQTAKKEETEAQSDYEDLLADATKKREEAARAMTEKEGSKASIQATIKKNKDKVTGLKNELDETVDVIKDLHLECDWLLQNFQERVKLRNAEVEALRRAKSTLSGAK